MIGLVEGIGAGVGAMGVGVIIGRFLPSGNREVNPKKAICGCTHHLAMHDRETTACSATVSVPVYSGSSNNTIQSYKQAPCACQHYVGPKPTGSVIS